MARGSRGSDNQTSAPTDGILRWYDLTPMAIDGMNNTEAKILDAARRCWVMYGASKMSLNDVADEAGVSRGSVYKYYENRGELLRRVLQYGTASQMDAL